MSIFYPKKKTITNFLNSLNIYRYILVRKKIYKLTNCVAHSLEHQRMLLYPILPSQKATLSIIPYHFIIHPTSKNSIILLFH